MRVMGVYPVEFEWNGLTCGVGTCSLLAMTKISSYIMIFWASNAAKHLRVRS